MQVIPVEMALELMAIFAGVIFSVIALIGIYYFSAEMRYRRWASSQLFFSISFLPVNMFGPGLIYVGQFIAMLFRVIASLMFLKAFSWKPLRASPIPRLHIGAFIGTLLYWIPVVGFSLAPEYAAIPTSLLMAFSFGVVSYLILYRSITTTRFQQLVGSSFLIWSISSIPMTLLPFLEQIVFVGYIQYIAQSMVTIAMFLSFLEDMQMKTESNLRLTRVLGSMVTHDLRNFLNVARSAMELMDLSDPEDIKLHSIAIKALDSAGDFMNETRDEILALASMEGGKQDLDLGRLVEGVISRVTSEHRESDVKIEFPPIENCFVYTSPIIAQAIWNILDNGVRYSENGTGIAIHCVEGRGVELHISDRAGGLNDKIKSQMTSLESGTAGLGLGMTMIRELSTICDVHLNIADLIENGQVVGTTFILSFFPAMNPV